MIGNTKKNKAGHPNTKESPKDAPTCLKCSGRGYYKDTSGTVQTCWTCLKAGRLK